MNLPKDPYILLSYINTKLRNEFNTLDELCNNLQINKEQLIDTLSVAGYNYSQTQNQFIPID